MTNRVDVELNSLPTVIGIANNRTLRRKKKCVHSGLITSILVIAAIVIPIAIIYTKEDEKKVKNTTITTITTTTTTVKTSITTKTTSLHSSTMATTTTTTEENIPEIENITTIRRWKFYDPNLKQTRYWYQVGNDFVSVGWIKENIIFRAYTQQMPGTVPVYQYASGIGNAWLNTLDTDLLSSFPDPDLWDAGWIKFYCHTTPIESETLQPIRRYVSQSKVHAYSNISLRMYLLTAETEAEEQPEWTFDKILMYALPPQ